jgi:alkaline phosphatase
MLRKALWMLTSDPDGFVLVVEGGRIDHAEHGNDLAAALGEFFSFDAAVGEAMRYQESDSTLAIVVTADHDTGGPGITSAERGYPGVDAIARLLEKDVDFVRWLTDDHVGTMVPIMALGPGHGTFAGIRDNTDTNRGLVRILGLGAEMGQ